MTLPALVPFATLELLPDRPRADGQTWMGGALTASHGVVFHVNDGNGDPYNWWTNPADPSVASAHLQIMKSGELRQYVPLDRVAWAEIDGNGFWHSVETEGFPTEPLTPAQFETFARLLAWGHASPWAWPLQVCDDPQGYGLGTHQMGGVAWGNHACPGPIRAAQRPALLARATALLNPIPAPIQEDTVRLYHNVATGEVAQCAPGFWQHVPNPSYLKLLQARGLPSEPPLDVSDAEFAFFKAFYGPAAPAVPPPVTTPVTPPPAATGSTGA